MLAKTEIIHNLLGEVAECLSNKDAGSGSAVLSGHLGNGDHLRQSLLRA